MKSNINAIIAATVLSIWLAGCGTQSPPAQTSVSNPGDEISAQVFPEPALPSAANTTGAGTQGYWSPTEPWPLTAIHASLMPNGNLMTWDMNGDGGNNPADGSNITFEPQNSVSTRGGWDSPTGDWRRVDIWDPRANAHAWANNMTTNMFCSGHVLLADGRLFVVGGHYGLPSDANGNLQIPPGQQPPFDLSAYQALNANSQKIAYQATGGGKKDINIFDWRTNTWSRSADMSKARWYASGTVLADGGVMVAGGDDEFAKAVPEVEIWRNGGFSTMTSDNANGAAWASYYPRLFQASNGQVFHAGLLNDMYSVDPSNTNPMQFAGKRDGVYRSYGNTVMFERDKILVVNGQQPIDLTATPPVNNIGYTKTAEIIDISADAGGTTAPTVNSLPNVPKGRFQANTTILADGTVLVTGGNDDPTGIQNSSTNAVMTPLLFKPNASATNGSWSNMADMAQSRQYHSVALLMPDGRVFSAGSGECTREGCTDLRDRSHEFFWPPYLFNSDGTLARRPKIVSAPSSARFGQTIRIGTPDASSITKVTWIRLGSVTHSDNMNQRSMTLSFSRSGDSLVVNAPANGNVAPPGHYMLFAVNANGTPSVARIIRIDN